MAFPRSSHSISIGRFYRLGIPISDGAERAEPPLGDGVQILKCQIGTAARRVAPNSVFGMKLFANSNNDGNPPAHSSCRGKGNRMKKEDDSSSVDSTSVVAASEEEVNIDDLGDANSLVSGCAPSV